jgi:pimeloyl-ACP methyl ester carboxylesterase
MDRRSFFGTALGLASMWGLGAQAKAKQEGDKAMSNDIVMLHGANAGGWCFDDFSKVFEAKGLKCHAPDLIGHGENKANATTALAGVGIAEYSDQMQAFLKTFDSPPVLLGHSMGAVIAQQLAAQGLARALVLVSPAPRAGILPPTGGEKQLDQDLMQLGAFWKTVIPPDFALACLYSLNRVPADQQRAVFDKFGPESGLALFQLFFWMLDQTGATSVATDQVRCPVLCLSGTDDKLVSLLTARATAVAYRGAPFWELKGRGHMLLVEPGADQIAERIAAWIPS